MQFLFIIIVVLVIGSGIWFFQQSQKRKRTAASNESRSSLIAVVKRIEEKKSIKIVRTEQEKKEVEHTSYVIVAQARHPYSNDLLTFRSFPFSEYPKRYTEGSELPVLVDLEKPTNYELKLK